MEGGREADWNETGSAKRRPFQVHTRPLFIQRSLDEASHKL